jgi:adenine-specific DNA-methyltransferase
MEDYRSRFQELLRRLFQFASADLDFGIYRIMNFKRGAIEKFIEKDLIEGVAAEQRLTEGADEVFVNGDSVIPGTRSLDPVFKGRMFAGVQT